MPEGATIADLQSGAVAHEHLHEHDHKHHHPPDHDHAHPHVHTHSATVVELNARILEKNERLAARNRGWFEGREILAVNLMSAPGAGKTTLLERTIADLAGKFPLSVIEGDQASLRDGERIRACGAPVVQVNTGTGCHLDAEMIGRGLDRLKPPVGALLVIENVGNLVCPALFDLGERRRVAILSVTEGDDKPMKYPHMFRAADLLLVNKIDLLPHVDFDVARAEAAAREAAPHITILRVSAKTGEGLAGWYDWLAHERGAVHTAVLS
ncbi:MAG TPA: hydrogenase nickel incorporation protein HypB [Rhizomicrobium sp.]|jgi:hydrogenase nickel incorporation protein HypB